MSDIMSLAYLLLLVFATTIFAFALWKIRQVHLKLYKIDEHVYQASNVLFRQFEALIGIYLDCGFTKGLPFTRGWAASPDFLKILVNHVLETRPKLVVECSSGVSTVVLAQCAKRCGIGHIFSLENDSRYAAQTRELLGHHMLEDWATVIDAPLIEYDISGGVWRWYDLANVPKVDIDLVVVDGPPNTVGKSARYPALPLLNPRLRRSGIMILDDANRSQEREAIEGWKREVPDLTVRFLDCEKGCAIIRFGDGGDMAWQKKSKDPLQKSPI